MDNYRLEALELGMQIIWNTTITKNVAPVKIKMSGWKLTERKLDHNGAVTIHEYVRGAIVNDHFNNE